jgi:integrase
MQMANKPALLEMPRPPLAPPKSVKPKAKRERGEGRLFKKSGSDRWWIQYYAGGRQIRESSGSDVKQVAVELLRQRLTECRAGQTPLVDAAKVSYVSMRTLLYDHYQAQRQGQGAKSLLRKTDGTVYLGTVPPLDRFFEGCVAADFTYHKLMAFVKDRQQAGRGDATINRSLTALKMMFKLAVKARRIPAMAVPEFPHLKEPPAREDYFTLEQYTKVSAALPEYLRPVFAVGFYCGLRSEEILSRKWSHIDLKAGLIHLLPGETKNNEGRTVPMAGPVLEMLRALRIANPESEFVFTRNGKPVKDFRSAWNAALKSAGLVAGRNGHTFHGTRRAFTTDLMRAGVNMKTAMALTGHKDPGVFRRYQQVDEKDAIAAARALTEYREGQNKTTGPATGPAKNKRKRTARK